VLFCHITSHVPTDKHHDLLEKAGGQGFPHIVFMDSEGKVLAEHDGPRDPDAFAKTGEKAKSFLALKAKAEKGDKAAQVDYALAALELGQIKAAEAREKLKGHKLSKAQDEKLAELLVTAEVKEIMETVTNDEATQNAAAKKFHEMKKAGKPAPADDRLVQPYWILMMNWAEDEKNAALFEECLKALKAKFADNPQAQNFFKAKEAKLKELKEGSEKK
jgi:hypothetical protein